MFGCLVLLTCYFVYDICQALYEGWEMRQPRELVQYHENLYFYGDVSDEGLQWHFDGLALIPDWLVSHYHDAGGNVFLTDTMFFPLARDFPERDVWGMFWTGNNGDAPEIWIYHNKYATFTSAHEFGHYLDYILETVSKNKEFEKVFDKELDSFLRFYEGNSAFSYPVLHGAFPTPEEYFAEFFTWYCIGQTDSSHRSSLIEKCPETYVFFDEMLDGLEMSY